MVVRNIFIAVPVTGLRVNPPKLGPKPEDLDWGLSKEAGGAREVLWKRDCLSRVRQVAMRRPTGGDWHVLCCGKQ